MRLIRAIGMGVISAVVLAGPAHAVNAWSVTASSCTIVEGQAIALVQGAQIGFAAGRTGTIRLMCSISDGRDVVAPNGPRAVDRMAITYQDSTGTGNTGVVRVRYVRTTLATAAPTVLGTFQSNAVPITTVTQQFANVTPSMMNFDTHALHIEVILQRSAGTEQVTATAIALTSFQPN